MTVKPTKPYTGKRILIWFVGFFLIVFLANGILTYYALETWPGLQTENSYVKGLNYNQEINHAADQKNSDWQITITEKPTQITNGRFEINIIRPLESLPPSMVSVSFIRAVQEGYDQEIILNHISNGRYAAPVNLPLSGQWNILIVVKSQNNFIYKIKDQVLVS